MSDYTSHETEQWRATAAVWARRALAAETRAEAAEAESARLREEISDGKLAVAALSGVFDANAALRAELAQLREERAARTVLVSKASDMISDMDKELDALKEAQRWRPVTETPDGPDEYLVVRRNGNRRRRDVGKWDGRSWGLLEGTVLYWQPLPPLPAAGEEAP